MSRLTSTTLVLCRNKPGAMISKGISWCLQICMDEYTGVAVLIGLLLVAIIWWSLIARKSNEEKARLPPGPWGLPIVGNLPFLDPELHHCFTQLSVKYGPVVKVQLGSKLAIVFSSPEVAKEVFKDNDAKLGDRDVPAGAFVGTYNGMDIVFASYGAHWRMMRMICVSELLSHARLGALYGLRRREVHEMVKIVSSKVGTSVDIRECVLLATFNIMTSMMWGNTLDGEERLRVLTEFREVAEKAVRIVGEVNISDLFPILSRFDLQGKEHKMIQLRIWFDQMFEYIINKRRKIESEEDPEKELKNKEKDNKDFVQVFLQLIDQNDPKTPVTITHLKAMFLDMILGGTTSTAGIVEWAMTELLNNLELMKRAQEELKRVVGPNNVVEESHMCNLPFLDAIVKEVHRLHPNAPLLIPRCAKESCVIGGYLIPKGAKIFVNVWAIHRDPKYWENPLEFEPRRFLNSSKQWDYRGNDFRYLPFGSGRRICVGNNISEKLVSYSLRPPKIDIFDFSQSPRRV